MHSVEKIIFVDIDGPLIPGRLVEHTSQIPIFDPYAVEVFNYWAKDAKIVFSTSWTKAYSTNDLKQLMAYNRLKFDYYWDISTRKTSTSKRHEEILNWLENRLGLELIYLVVDDDPNCQYITEIVKKNGWDKDFRGGWVNVDFSNGLTEENFRQGCEILEILQNS